MLNRQTLLEDSLAIIKDEVFELPEAYVKHIETLSHIIAEKCENNDSPPFYTLHDFSHNVRILEILRQLLTIASSISEYGLSTSEKYLLIVASLFHDIGMLDLTEIHGVQSPEQIRENHHKRSAQWVLQNTRKLGLDSAEASIVAFIIWYHRNEKVAQLEQCPETFLAGSEKIRTQLLAAYLRLADALHRDQSRAPEKELSFYRMAGMPTDAKFHWIKARAVRGIYINKDKRIIEVNIAIPEEGREKEGKEKEDFRPLQEFVKQEIEDELESVRPILASTGQPVYLGVECRCVPVCGLLQNSEAGREILELNNIVSIDVSPNARKLATVVLDCIKQLAGFEVDNEKEILKCLESLKGYSKDMIGKVIARRCHVAVGRLFIDLIKLLKGLKPSEKSELDIFHDKLSDSGCSDDELRKDLESIINEIRFHYRDQSSNESEHRKEMLKNIKAYFTAKRDELNGIEKKLIEVGRGLEAENILNPFDRILLYGNSQSVVDMLTGYGEANASRYETLEILVAECRPKAKHTSVNKIEYNDGLEYAEKLCRHGYKKVAIIPDAAIAHVFCEPEKKEFRSLRMEGRKPSWVFSEKAVTKVFLGFNGLDIDKRYMVHSCGHLAAVAMGLVQKEKGKKVKIYLVGTSNKCARNVVYRHLQTRDSGNWLVIPSDRKLSKGNLYNPGEDIVEFSLFDGIISDVGIYTDKDWAEKFIQDLPLDN